MIVVLFCYDAQYSTQITSIKRIFESIIIIGYPNVFYYIGNRMSKFRNNIKKKHRQSSKRNEERRKRNV